jgi:glycosyltransferase involved in cell wall biosynthesis
MPESFTEPEAAYATAKRRGMDLVTLTDHNTISGALEIAHHPDVVIGVEATVEFPEDRVPVHVLAWGLDEARWADMDRLRGNLYELVDYMGGAGLPHALAHPLHRVGGDLGADHLERCLLLFRLWEGRNGARPRESNEVTARIANSASRQLLDRLAEKHGLAPRGDGPPALTGGSDDHGSYDIAATWTVAPAAAGPAELLDHLRAGRVRPGGGHGSAAALAHSVGSLAAKAYLDRGQVAIPERLRGIVGDLLHHPLTAPAPAPAGPSGGPRGIGEDVLARIRADRGLVRRYRRLGRAVDGSERSHARLRLATGWLHEELVRRALDPRGLRLGTLGKRAEALAGAGMLALPYLLAAYYSAGEVRYAEAVEQEFFGARPAAPGPVPAVMVTDTFAELNGVAGTMRRLAAHAGAHPERRMTVVTCGAGVRPGPGHVDLPAVARMPVPAYGDAAWRMGVPSVVDLLDAVEASGARVVHAATPGPMGIAALVVARTVGLPFAATYHTELGSYALELTGDRFAAALADRAVRWFYAQADRVYVPTRATAEGLLAGGLDPERIAVFGRGTDTSRFGPEHRSRVMRARLGGRGETVLLYVGRLSPEKGLFLLADAFRRASAAAPGLRLALVGDGPARDGLERALAGTPHRFVGPLRGRELAAAYASADLFCLPSATETFGQVVTEAAASGLPAVVLDAGAAAEHVADGESGVVVPADDPAALAGAIARLAADPELRAAMGGRARTRALGRPGWAEVLDGLLDGYAGLTGGEPAPGARRPRSERGAAA